MNAPNTPEGKLQQLEIYNNVFELLIRDSETFGPLLARIKVEKKNLLFFSKKYLFHQHFFLCKSRMNTTVICFI